MVNQHRNIDKYLDVYNEKMLYRYIRGTFCSFGQFLFGPEGKNGALGPFHTQKNPIHQTSWLFMLYLFLFKLGALL